MSKLLSSYGEVKAVKPRSKKGKPPSLKISMRDGGIPIYGSSFSVKTDFDMSGGLAEVTLVSESECANDAIGKYEKIAFALSEKYGAELTGNRPLDEIEVSSALLKSYQSEQNEVVTYGFANEDVAVALVIAFHKTRPPPYVGGGGFAQGLYAIASSLYEAEKEKCGNTGDERVSYAIKYLSRAEFDARVDELESQRDAEDNQAHENL